MTKLRHYRQQRDISGKTVAMDLGMTPHSLWRVETGATKLTAELLWRLAKYYGCTPEELMGTIDETATGQAPHQTTGTVSHV